MTGPELTGISCAGDGECGEPAGDRVRRGGGARDASHGALVDTNGTHKQASTTSRNPTPSVLRSATSPHQGRLKSLKSSAAGSATPARLLMNLLKHSPRMGRPTGTSPTLSGDGDFCMDVSWWRGPFPIDAEPGRHAAAGFELLYALLRSEQANTPAQLTCVRRTAQSAAVRDIFPHGHHIGQQGLGRSAQSPSHRKAFGRPTATRRPPSECFHETGRGAPPITRRRLQQRSLPRSCTLLH